MAESSVPNLTFSRMQYGTHQEPWDLNVLLYKGAAAMRRDKARIAISAGELGVPTAERLALVDKVHEVIATKIELGIAQVTIVYMLEGIWRFFAWSDQAGLPLAIDGAVKAFVRYADALRHRARILNEITDKTAIAGARNVADVLARVLNYPHKNPGAGLLRLVGIRASRHKKHVLGAQADKQNLTDTFAFGHFMTDLCSGLDAKSVRGALPLTVTLRDDRTLLLLGGLRAAETRSNVPDDRKDAEIARAPLPDNASVVDHRRRSRLLNTRIEAEMLIFIAQTGMNLTQATALVQEHYRWQTDGEDILAYRVYKGRRHGDAIFRCFRGYRAHFKKYLTWLDDVGLSAEDGRIFPFVYTVRIPAAHKAPSFSAIKHACLSLGVSYIGPAALRRTRLNWLLRRSQDPDLTAQQSGHLKQTLIRQYEQPHHQSAAAEMLRFHARTDPTLKPPGPGLCSKGGQTPAPVANVPEEAPLPDCVSPDGCLFCVHHRDVLSHEYCWKLSSHLKLKTLELSLYKAPIKESVHPAARVIDRLKLKLEAMRTGSEIRSRWVRDAEDSVRAGQYHPVWKMHIELIEVIS